MEKDKEIEETLVNDVTLNICLIVNYESLLAKQLK